MPAHPPGHEAITASDASRPGVARTRQSGTGPSARSQSAGHSSGRSGVGRRLSRQRQKLRPPDTLAVRGVETAGDNEYGAGHGPDVRHFAEDEEAEDADPQQLRIRKWCEHGGVGITEGEPDDPLPHGRPKTHENA